MNSGKDRKMKFHHTFAFKLFVTFSSVMLVTLFLITFFMTKDISEKLVDQELKLNQQIVTKTAEYLDNKIIFVRKIIKDIYYSDKGMQKIINDMLNTDTKDKPMLEYIEKKERFEKLFMSALYNDEDIIDIIVIGKNKKNAYYFSKEWSTVTLQNAEFTYPWVEKVIEDKASLTIIPSYTPLHSKSGPILTYSAITSIYDANSKSGTMGAIIVNMSAKKIANAYKMYEEDLKGDIIVYDNAGGVIYDTSDKYYGNTYPYFDSVIQGKNEGLFSQKQIVSVAHSNSMDLTVLSITPEYKLLKNINSLKMKVYITLIIAILVILIIFYFLSVLLVSRINTIEKTIEKVKKGNLSARIPVGKTKDELGIIALQFNDMCGKLDNYIKRSYLYEIRMKETELMALQSQINPHFIYNTLEIIRIKAVMQKNHDVANMIYLLSNLFRRSFRSSDIVVSIKDEIDYCMDYLEINSIRFHDRIKVEYFIDEEIMEYGILKLVLQPLVENIIVHGVNDNSKLVQISISGYLEEENVVIIIEDTGKGIDEIKMREIVANLNSDKINNGNSHIGLKNVNDRFKIVFGEKYGLHIHSIENELTSVKVILPAIRLDAMRKLIKKDERNSITSNDF